jgi:hypothetical protein
VRLPGAEPGLPVLSPGLGAREKPDDATRRIIDAAHASDHAEARWPPGTESTRSTCGPHCRRPPVHPTPGSDLSEHCPRRYCHHAYHRCRDGKVYTWFAGRRAELLTAEVTR